jgi:hypothetical protein
MNCLSNEVVLFWSLISSLVVQKIQLKSITFPKHFLTSTLHIGWYIKPIIQRLNKQVPVEREALWLYRCYVKRGSRSGSTK